VKKKLVSFILKLLGWKIYKHVDISNINKCVIAVAPHTSMMDFFIGWLAFYKLNIPVSFLIKKEFFLFPFGFFLKKLGGIPVKINRGSSLLYQAITMFNSNDKIFLVITPEGTRKYNAQWKKGFYFIALKTNVPILIAYIDYKEKKGGVAQIINPTGNYKEDLEKIQSFYKTVNAKYPEKFNLSRMYWDE